MTEANREGEFAVRPRITSPRITPRSMRHHHASLLDCTTSFRITHLLKGEKQKFTSILTPKSLLWRYDY